MSDVSQQSAQEEEEQTQSAEKAEHARQALIEAGLDVGAGVADVVPEVMTPQERRHAAARGLYEAERASIALSAAQECLAELAGLSEEEIEQVLDVAEQDEYHALGFADEEDAREAGY